MNVLGMGPLELVFIAALALVVFGPDKLPELARQLGRAFNEVRRISSDASAELQRSLNADGPGVSRPRQTIGGTRQAERQKDPEGRPEGPLPPY
jgi:TatA/E family protein of Tat protein translocase